eukprot:1160116-Pelagomonas_calceolata.AAC.1
MRLHVEKQVAKSWKPDLIAAGGAAEGQLAGAGFPMVEVSKLSHIESYTQASTLHGQAGSLLKRLEQSGQELGLARAIRGNYPGPQLTQGLR